jgi:hypothetical protein
VKLLLTTYFEGVTPNLDTITALPVQGLHVDLVHGKDDVRNCTSVCQQTGCSPRGWSMAVTSGAPI